MTTTRTLLNRIIASRQSKCIRTELFVWPHLFGHIFCNCLVNSRNFGKKSVVGCVLRFSLGLLSEAFPN